MDQLRFDGEPQRHQAFVWAILLICLAGLGWQAKPAAAIDPQRTLTQVLMRKWQFPQGLPQPRVLAIRQTADGHLWLGTASGLYQFDGLHFTPALTSCGCPLGNLWVQALVEDAQHQLWIATIGDGLVRLSNGECDHFGLDSGLPSLNVQCLLVDRQGTLWIGTDRGLARMLQGKIVPFPPQQEYTISNVRAICEMSTGTICIGGDQPQLNLWRDGQFLTRQLSTIQQSAAVRALLGLPDGTLFVGTTDGLVRLDAAGESKLGRADGLADDVIETLAYSSTKQVWAGTRDGISRISDEEIETLRTRDGLSQSTVCAIWEDHEKSMWIGTKNGLNQYVARRTIPLTMSEGLPSNETGALIQDQSGEIWIGTLDAGLARYQGRRCETIAQRNSGLPSQRVTALAGGEQNELWIGTDQGLCRLRDRKIEQRWTQAQGLPADTIQSLARSESGRLWIGTARGLARWDGSQISRFAQDSEISRLPIRVILPEPNDSLLVATEGGGLFRCRNGAAQPWLADVPEMRTVTALIPGTARPDQGDQPPHYWAATRGDGLFLIRGETAIRLTVQQGLYDDEISGLVLDDQRRLWMACSRGIFFVPEQDLQDLADGRRQEVASTQFSPLEALRTIECQQGVQPPVWKMQDGRIWFSTIHGVIIIDPAAIYRRLPPPTVSVDQLQVNGQIVDLRKTLHLPAGRTNLMFCYSALSFASPTRIQFRYRLEGFDKDWVQAGSRREAYYTNVPPGEYRFVVSAANPENEWATVTTPVSLVVGRPFYRTFWFYGLCGGVLWLTIWGILRLRVLQVRTRLNAALAERTRIARDLHDTLIQGFSGVTMQMQAIARQLRDPVEQRALQEVINDAGICLREARQTVSGLRNVSGSAPGLLDALNRAVRQLTETQDLQSEVHLPVSIPPVSEDVQYNLLRIAQEAMTNVVKHAHAEKLTVALDFDHRQLHLSIQDDGRGFLLEDEETPAGHYGLIGMRERALQIQADFQIESSPGSGTRVDILLPGKAASRIPAAAHDSSEMLILKESHT